MRYLQRSSNQIFYFRFRLPTRLRVIVGKTEIRFSLKTTRLKTATLAMTQYTFYVQQLKQLAKMKLDSDTLSFVTKQMVAHLTTHHKINAPRLNHYMHAKEEQIEGRVDQFIGHFYDDLFNHNCRVAKESVRRYLSENNIQHDDSRLVEYLAEQYNRTSLELFEADEAYLNGDRIKSRQLQKGIEEEGEIPSPTQIGGSVNIPQGERLVELLEKYRSETVSQSIWTKKTEEENVKILELLFELFPIEYIGQVTKELARQAKENLLKLPSNRKKMRAYRDLNLKQILALDLPESARMSIRTVIKYISRWTTFFSWCKNQGYCDSNVFEGLNLKDNREQEEKRTAFSSEQLQTIFSQSIFTDQRKTIPDFHYWLPLLALFQGARLAELCGLRTQDIRLIDEIWCIDISPNDYRPRLKNRSAIRILPIHKKLIELGFLEYVKSRPEGLLLDITVSKKGVGENAGKWFGGFKKNLGFDRLVTFHSFRHNFTDFFISQGLLDTRLKALLGHTEKSITFRVYSQGKINIPVLEDMIDKLVIKEVDGIKNWAKHSIS